MSMVFRVASHSDALLAENDVVIPARHDVLARQQQLFDGGGNALFSNTGFRTAPSSRSRLKFCMFRAPT
jgi:hypothetical protein